MKNAEEKRKKVESTEPAADPNVPQEKSKIRMGKLGGKKQPAEDKGNAKPGEEGKHEGGAVPIFAKGDINDVEHLRELTQSMTKTIAPLGKSMDFISEDVENMTKEYENWHNKSKAAKQSLEEELKKTETELQPLEDKLAEIEEQIREQKGKITNIKSQIFKNDGIIQGLLASVIAK